MAVKGRSAEREMNGTHAGKRCERIKDILGEILQQIETTVCQYLWGIGLKKATYHTHQECSSYAK